MGGRVGGRVGGLVVKPADAGDPYTPGSGDRTWTARHYDLEITYRPESNRLEGRATIEAEALADLDRFGVDLAGLSVGKVGIDGTRVRKFAHRGRKLTVTPSSPLPRGTRFTLTVGYEGKPHPVRSPWGHVGFEELRQGALVAGQPTGAPTWFPCNDHPADKATYRITVTADSPYTVVANGSLTKRRSRASVTSWTYEQPEPMAAYLATVQIGHYEIVETKASGALLLLARPPRLARPAARDFERQPEMLRCFGALFGPYPFVSYTALVTDDPLEIPLEAQTLSIFGANHVDGRRGHERLIAHELAHQWFGNSLTISSWADIWLHEGFACYAEWLWSEWAGDLAADELAERYWKKLRDSPHDLLLADPGQESMFDDRVYKRGALTLHALRALVGDADFFDLLRAWVRAHRHGSVSTEEFRTHVRSAAGSKAEALLSQWLDHRSVPARPKIGKASKPARGG